MTFYFIGKPLVIGVKDHMYYTVPRQENQQSYAPKNIKQRVLMRAWVGFLDVYTNA